LKNSINYRFVCKLHICCCGTVYVKDRQVIEMITWRHCFTGRSQAIAALLFIISSFFIIVGCDPLLISKKGGDNQSQSMICYIIGYDVCSGVNIENETAKAGGYLLVSENLIDTLATYNLPDNLYTFPSEIMPKNVFGFNLFPQVYRSTYKVQMTYISMTEEEQRNISKPCVTLYPMLHNIRPTYVVIKSIIRLY